MTEKPVIAVDLDEVLGRFVYSLLRFHNERYGTSFTEDEWHSYHFMEVWGGTEPEARVKVHAFFQSHWFLDDLEVLDGAQAAMEELKQHCTLYVVTSRQLCIEEATRKWVSKHFPGVFEEVLFGNHYGMEGVKKSKPDMCASINAACLIDDAVGYTEQCAATLPHAILFGDYAWNKKRDTLVGLDNVCQASSWSDALEYIKKNILTA
eukprot:m.32490 g.32490  ORF g.32490 m.32490 type:complete len:207 (+) comp5541_c0_seq1:104-724(+)